MEMRILFVTCIMMFCIGDARRDSRSLWCEMRHEVKGNECVIFCHEFGNTYTRVTRKHRTCTKQLKVPEDARSNAGRGTGQDLSWTDLGADDGSGLPGRDQSAPRQAEVKPGRTSRKSEPVAVQSMEQACFQKDG
ncbi:hypothetical protein ISCGN_019049 [Ixodes scapularis]